MSDTTPKVTPASCPASCMESIHIALSAGLFKPSMTSLVVALITCLTLASGFLYFLKPALVIKHSERLATYDGDDDIFITANVLKLQDESDPPPSVYVVGDSGLREAILEQNLISSLRQSDRGYRFVDLRSGGQSLLESLAIIDNIKANTHSVIVLGISAKSLVFSKQTYDTAATGIRRGFTSKALAKYLTDNQKDSFRITGIYAIDNFYFFLPRLANYLRTRDKTEIKRIIHQHRNATPKSLHEIPKDVDRFLDSLFLPFDNYVIHIDAGLAALEAIELSVKKKPNMKLLLIEKPLHPDFFKKYLGREFKQRYLNLLTRFTQSPQIDYFDPTDTIVYDPQDFSDLVHVIGGSTATDFTKALTVQILQLSK